MIKDPKFMSVMRIPVDRSDGYVTFQSFPVQRES